MLDMYATLFAIEEDNTVSSCHVDIWVTGTNSLYDLHTTVKKTFKCCRFHFPLTGTKGPSLNMAHIDSALVRQLVAI